MTATPLPPTEGWELDYDKLIADAFANHKYRQGTRECVAFKNGAHWAMHNYARQSRADLEAENQRLREALNGANEIVRQTLSAAPVAQQPHVGDSQFESWYSSEYDPNGKGDKQRARDAYAAGMSDPAVQQSPKLEDIEQYRMQMAGICTAAIGYWKEVDSIHPVYDTPALREVAKLYAKYDALYKAQQPQEIEVQCPVCNHKFYEWPNDKQPQAEAVQPTHVSVPVEPDEMWAYRVIRHHQPHLDVGCEAWLKCLKELLHWHAAIAAQGAKP